MGGLVVLVLMIIIPGHSSTPEDNEDTINPNTDDVLEVTIDGALGNGRAFLSGSEWVGYRYNEKAPSNCCTSCKLKHPSTEGFTYAVKEQKCVCYTFEKGSTIRTKSYKGLESQLCGSSATPKTLYSKVKKSSEGTEKQVPVHNQITSLKGFKVKVPGEQCKRDCTKDPEDNKYCDFTFTLSQLFSDTPGRLADGMHRPVLVYNGVLPGPTIVVCEGDRVFLKLINELTGDNEKLLGKKSKLSNNATTLHFHGIRAKGKESHINLFNYKENFTIGYMEGGELYDGVPMVTQCPVPSGESYEYQLPGSGSVDSDYNNAPAGSYLYHSHMGDQRINGAQGKLIIMPRKANRSRYDVDLPENSLILQEWYPNLYTEVAGTLLVNGKGKQDDIVYKCDDRFDEKACIEKYKKGEKVHLIRSYKRPIKSNYLAGRKYIPEPDYEVFNITKQGRRYRFRIIGAIGENVPIRISIEDHTFTVISVDSIDIEPVPEFDALWVTAGERYDIVIHTKAKPRRNLAYKINVFHRRRDSIVTRCSMAWLKYPNQKVDRKYVANCSDMEYESFKKVLNPVPDDFSKWRKPEDSAPTEYIYPIDLNSHTQEHRMDAYLNTQYINMTGRNFNNIRMPFPQKYPDIPFLLQSRADVEDRCGVKCDFNGCSAVNNGFTNNDGSEQECQHVIQQPLQPGQEKYWFEVVLINAHDVAHPIHHHGGWFNIIGMGQFDTESINITKNKIIEMDHSCPEGTQCLHRDFYRPIHKDTIQVPTNGYVIFRVPLDNPGVTFMHCHIGNHLEVGMAMIFQIGETWQWKVKQNENKDCYDIPGLEKGW